MIFGRKYLSVSLCVALVSFAGVEAQAQQIEEFYKGKTVSVITSTGAGGPYDIVARAVARYMWKYIPGTPNMIIKNMPGAGHLLATNYMYNMADKDGTYIATIYNGIPMYQVLDGKGVHFDASKFGWLGSTGTSNLVTMVWYTAPVRTVEDLMKTEVIAGAAGVGAAGAALYPTVMNNILGTKFKLITGYKDAREVNLALQRGEVQSTNGVTYSGLVNELSELVKSKKVVFLVQVGSAREKDLPDVPLMHELARNDEQRQILKLFSSPVAIGRPFLTTPGVPQERLTALRNAFDATMKDPEFIAEARRLNLDYSPLGGEELTKLVDDTVHVRQDLIEQAKKAMEAQ